MTMADWEKMGYESECDYNRDRFYDEVESDACGDCDEWASERCE